MHHLSRRAAREVRDLDRIKELEQERTAFENRYQDITARFYEAQAAYGKSERQREACRQVVQAKQEVIHVLLPHYPHPLTPELRFKIELSC